MNQAAVYQLGRHVFSIKNCNAEFEQTLSTLLPHYKGSAISEEELHEISMGCSKDVRELVNHVLKRHRGCVWIDAACLVTPDGCRVLIAGHSGAGKSTIAMALAMEAGWKVISEDLLLIDCQTNKLITFASPFSLKKGTMEVLTECVGRGPEPVLQGEWSPIHDMAAQSEHDAHFHLAISLEAFDKMTLQITELSEIELLLKILPMSNSLRIRGSSDKLGEYLQSSACIQMRGGDLRSRINAITARCSNLTAVPVA